MAGRLRRAIEPGRGLRLRGRDPYDLARAVRDQRDRPVVRPRPRRRGCRSREGGQAARSGDGDRSPVRRGHGAGRFRRRWGATPGTGVAPEYDSSWNTELAGIAYSAASMRKATWRTAWSGSARRLPQSPGVHRLHLQTFNPSSRRGWRSSAIRSTSVGFPSPRSVEPETPDDRNERVGQRTHDCLWLRPRTGQSQTRRRRRRSDAR